jgi:hypothetical protein
MSQLGNQNTNHLGCFFIIDVFFEENTVGEAPTVLFYYIYNKEKQGTRKAPDATHVQENRI